MWRKSTVAGLCLAAAAAVSLLPARAEAHAIGLSQGSYEGKGQTLTAKLVFARGEVAQLMPSLDANRDGHVTAIEVEAAKPALETTILGGVRVTTEGEACTAKITSAGLTEADGLLVEGKYTCPKPGAMKVDVALLDDLAFGHRHAARSGSNDELLYRGHRELTVTPLAADAPDAPASDPAAAPTPSKSKPSALGFFKMGIEHILTGYDHLVFLFGLILLRARVKELLATVTAFTVAHSISLALAVLGIVSPSARIVEPAIALSIAYVGIENFFVKDASKRWRITFPFGLIHGFGFAGALQEIALPKAAVPTALVGFNLGVEAGQLAVLALVLPLVMLLRDKQKWFEPTGVRVLSGAVALAGGIWFVSRIVSG